MRPRRKGKCDSVTGSVRQGPIRAHLAAELQHMRFEPLTERERREFERWAETMQPGYYYRKRKARRR